MVYAEPEVTLAYESRQRPPSGSFEFSLELLLDDILDPRRGDIKNVLDEILLDYQSEATCGAGVRTAGDLQRATLAGWRGHPHPP